MGWALKGRLIPLELLVVGPLLDLRKLVEVDRPVVSDLVGDQVSQHRVAQQQPPVHNQYLSQQQPLHNQYRKQQHNNTFT